MKHQTVNAKYPICARAQAIQDMLMVSAFAGWAAVLGLSPVLIVRALTG